ncbi:hypothetical protein V6615_02030 [Oscillospiraceae bacterium PP1C4]
MALRQKSRTSPVLITLLSLICLVLIAVGVMLFLSGTGGGAGSHSIKGIFQVDDLDPNATIGALPGSPINEKSPGENIFSYRINSTPMFSSDGTSGDILVENPHFNKYLMVLEIASGDQLLYQSQYIAPNQYIKTINLQKTPDAGKHSAIAYLNAIDPKTMDLIGTLECPITITVK